MSGLSPLALQFLNRFQGGFPLVARPYGQVAAELGCDEDELLQLIGVLVETGALSRFGPIFDASRLGGGQTLAALSVPADAFTEIAAQINSLPQVAHNYRREHHLNMWFVVAAASPDGVAAALAEIQRRTGLPIYNFPKLHEFYLGLWLHLDEQGGVDTVPVPERQLQPARPLDAFDHRLIAATQNGLPLVAEPYGDLAGQLGGTAEEIMARLQAMLDSGVVRRLGAVPNHYRLGLRGNGMTVWDVPDELAVALGERIGRLDCVSHSYLRPRYPGVWPYNLFAMVHGRDRDAVLAKRTRLAELLAPHCRASDVLFSSEILKKTGLRLAA